MSNYYRLRIDKIHPSFEEDISKLCIELGSTGTAEILNFSQPDLTYDPQVLRRSVKSLDAFFLEKPSAEQLQKLKNDFPQIELQLLSEENQDWLSEWKKHFKPFLLVDDYWVVPSWLESPAAVERTLNIDPGMAFGTGTHATTQMAAYFINKLCKKFPQNSSHILDVGTGTGILALLAEKCGAGMITGIEIDPEARRVARENVLLNKSKNVMISDLQLDEIRDVFDVVIANIIDGVLLKLKSELLRVLKLQGHLFLTGILTEREDLFFQSFIDDSNLEVIQRLEKDEWVGYWVRKVP
jgi:ribosomal protein L11 methyltransferase